MITNKITDGDHQPFRNCVVNNPVNKSVNNLKKTVNKFYIGIFSQILSSYSQQFSQNKLKENQGMTVNIGVTYLFTRPYKLLLI
jgi:hypothetical protein